MSTDPTVRPSMLDSAAGVLLRRLAAHGIDRIFVNAGTDFPPLVEAFAEARAKGVPVPDAVACAHEHLALGLAHGRFLLGGGPQAVILHTNVGLANGVIGAINAACDQVPLLLMSGRTPVSEHGHPASRTVPIGWGQEMRDQAAMVRECCKWEFELRYGAQIPELVDRALAVARSTPAGPVYLGLPREPLYDPVPADLAVAPPRLSPFRTVPDPGALGEAARLLAGARRPLVIAQRGPRDPEVFARFAAWAERTGAAVCSYWALRCAVPTDHPGHVGADPLPFLAHADVILVLDSLAPWQPRRERPAADARVIQLGPDPLFSRFPVRMFPADVALAGETDAALALLLDRLDGLGGGADPDWRRTVRAEAARRREAARARAADATAPLDKAAVSLALDGLLEERPSTVFSELGALYGVLRRRAPDSWFQEPYAGGLGWSLPAAMGAKLADPDRDVVAVMGDGSFLFANPAACLRLAAALRVAVLAVVVDNGGWGAVRRSVRELHPDGFAVRANEIPMTGLGPRQDFASIARASGVFGITVERRDELPAALAAALARTRSGEPAVVHVFVSGD